LGRLKTPPLSSKWEGENMKMELIKTKKSKFDFNTKFKKVKGKKGGKHGLLGF
jgi:hypothetical protein